MKTCPRCRERIWHYDRDIWTCRHGHRTRIKDPAAQTAAVDRRWPLPLATIAGSGLLTVLLVELLK